MAHEGLVTGIRLRHEQLVHHVQTVCQDRHAESLRRILYVISTLKHSKASENQ